MKTYRNTSNVIRACCAITLAFSLCFAIITECNIVAFEGMLTRLSDNTMYIIEVTMLFITGAGILAALKGFNWLLHHSIYKVEDKERMARYRKYSLIRVAMLGIIVFAGAFFYYTTLENWGMYYALAAFVSIFFCLPSAEGVKIEMEGDK